MKIDRVLTVNEYYDGPRLGIAELNGVPHIYEAEFDHSSDDYGDTYYLSPIEEDLLELVLEDWKIWLRWDAAYKKNETPHSTHPALAQDRARHEMIKKNIGDRLKTDPASRVHMRAKFRLDGNAVEWRSSENDA